MRRLSLVPLVLLALALPVRAQEEDEKPAFPKDRLGLDLWLEWETVSSPMLSPDGRRIAFTRRWTDKVDDRYQSELWLMEADGSRPRFLAEGSSPRWSPDGSRIAFLGDGKPRGSQIHVLWIDTREVSQITRVEESPSGLRWSPDGTKIAFHMVVPEKDALKIRLPKAPKGAKWVEGPKVITRLHYRRDGQGYRPSGYHHLFTVDAIAGGTPRQVTEGDFEHRNAEWTPDGRRLVFSGLREKEADWMWRESEIYAIEVESGRVERLTTREGPDNDPVVSPDGRFIAYRGYDKNRDTYNVDRLYVMDADGGNSRSLTAEFDRDPSDVFWAPDSSGVYFTARSEGTSDLHFVPIGGAVRPVTRGTHVLAVSDLHGRLAVGTRRTPGEPDDIVRIDLAGGGRVERLTRVNDDVLEGVRLGEVEEIRYASADGLEIQGWIVKPPDFDPAKRYPLVLQIHGGPHAMYDLGFDFERQNHAANGFVLLYTNPRGSTGYVKAFGNAIDNAYPGRDYDDLMRGVDEVIARGYIDEENLFVYGGSGGGVLTAWIVGHTNRFRAAVSMYPVTNWISFVGTTDGSSWYHNFERLPWEDITEHWERSPLRVAGSVTTPTLFLTGELDLRTPMGQTEELYQALRFRKVDTAMIRIPDEYHGASAKHPSNRLRRILYVREWFEKHRRDREEAVPAEAAKR